MYKMFRLMDFIFYIDLLLPEYVTIFFLKFKSLLSIVLISC